MSSPTTQAWGGAEDVAPVQLPHPVRMRVLGAVMVAVFLSALDQTVVGTALPTIITDLGGNGLYVWAITAYLLTATISGPLYGKISDLFGRRPVFLFGISVFILGSHPGRPEPGDVAAGRRARHPGPRRRRDLPARDGDHRRPLLAVRARPLPGPVRRRVRAVEPARPGHRRPDHRHDRLAVRVLRQHPDRPRGPVHDPALPAGLPPRRRQAEDRLPRRGAVHGRAGADPHRADQQAVGGLDRPHGGRPDPAGRARPGRVRVDRVARGRADRAARAVPDPRVRGLGGLGVPGDVRVLRGGGVPAALVPGRRRLVRDGLGLPDAAAPRRADRLGGRVGADRGPDRPLPAGWCSRR